MYDARCHDSGEHILYDKAKLFKEEFDHKNNKKNPNVLNLYSMRLGINAI